MNIYGLFDPRDGSLKYIGKTTNVKKRFWKHLHDNSITRKTCWIKSLKSNDLIPEVEVLDEVNDEDWKFWEQWYIQYFQSLGCQLKNDPNCPGGEGNIGMSGKKHKPETIEKMRASKLGNKNWLGKHHSEETKLIISRERKKLGFHQTDESKSKISKKLKGRKLSGQVIQQRLLSNKIKKENKNVN